MDVFFTSPIPSQTYLVILHLFLCFSFTWLLLLTWLAGLFSYYYEITESLFIFLKRYHYIVTQGCKLASYLVQALAGVGIQRVFMQIYVWVLYLFVGRSSGDLKKKAGAGDVGNRPLPVPGQMVRRS